MYNYYVKREILLLKERGLKAYERAKDAFEKGDYDWSIFLLEQSVQLLVKYFLVLKIGYFPKTHRLIGLIEEAGQLDHRFTEFLEAHRDELLVLEDAYINSRYMAREYSKIDVENKFRIFEEILKIVEKHEID